MKELTIIGGGLAGLALGIALRRRNVPVVLHEAGRYPRHRVCGDFINGATQATFENLGIASCLRDARRHRSTCWYSGASKIFKAELPEEALGISRFTLDQRLAEEFVRLEGDLRTKSRAPREPREAQVWAAGRPIVRKSRWLGLKVHLHRLPMEADLEMHLGRKAGYLGLAPVDEHRVNACGLFKRAHGITGNGPDLLWNHLEHQGLSTLARRLRDAECDPNSFVGVSALAFGWQPQKEERCPLGDAHSLIPPFTGNGMSMALQAAETALDPLLRYSRGDTPWQTTEARIQSALHTLFRARIFTARLLHPFLLSNPGRAALSLSARAGLLPFRHLFRFLR